jgi:hypothetical protein
MTLEPPRKPHLDWLEFWLCSGIIVAFFLIAAFVIGAVSMLARFGQ